MKVGKIIYRVELATGPDSALVFCEAEIEADTASSVVASLKVDNMELLSSQRIPLQKGPNKAVLKPVRIVRPLKTPYLMSLTLQKSEKDIVVVDNQELLLG